MDEYVGGIGAFYTTNTPLLTRGLELLGMKFADVQKMREGKLMKPSDLGWNGSLTNLFGGNKSEATEFKGEPERQSLTEPPAGYQTPSPNFAYGTGPKESLNKGYYDVVGDKQR